MGASRLDSLVRVEVTSAAELRKWLRANHRKTESVWLIRYKKSAGDRYLPYERIAEEVLCFGWIDGLARGLDEERSMLLLSPRKARSVWSKINKGRVAELIASRRMTAAGHAVIDRAKKDGSWDVLNDAEELVIPLDLAQAFLERPGATAAFEQISRSARKAYLTNLTMAKRATTRQKIIEQILLRVSGG